MELRFESGQRIPEDFLDGRVRLSRARDGALRQLQDRCRNKLRKAKDEVTRCMCLALLVSEASGRSGAHGRDLAARHAQALAQAQAQAQEELLLGELLGKRGCALARQRALLFKALSDGLDGPACTCEASGESAWNVVSVQGGHYVVDLLFDPGALYEERSQRLREYRRCMAECQGAPAAVVLEKAAMPRPPWHVEAWELSVFRDRRLGRGGFGEVFQGSWQGAVVAVKEVKDQQPTDGDVVDFILEIALLSQLNHPNIVRFWRGSIEVHKAGRSLLMVTEFVRQGGLSRLLHGHGGPALPEALTLGQALSLALDVARGTQYLHSQRVLHLDLKSPNVLCTISWTAKLCDFGLAKIRALEQPAVHSTLQGVSPIWAPPEMFGSPTGLTEKADCYSFAIILLELLARQVPFHEVSPAQLPGVKASGRLPAIAASVPEDCAALIRQCCQLRPELRPSMGGVVARLREILLSHNVRLSDVRPPAALAGDQEQRLRDCELAAAQRLKDLDGERAALRQQLGELQRGVEQLRQRGAAPEHALQVDAFVQEVTSTRFRCGLCSKLFRGPEFVRRHVLTKHQQQLRRAAEDAYFDCDISHEDSLPVHRSLSLRPRAASRRPLMQGCFSQQLQDCAEAGRAGELRRLVASRADPAQASGQPLLEAARQGHAACVEALLDLGGGAAGGLQAAAAEGHVEVLEALLLARADVDQADQAGKTALLLAGENGHSAACARLWRGGASASCRTPEGETLLHAVSRFGDAELIGLVVSWGADMSAQDRDGWTPLHEAAHWGAGAVSALCAARADVDARSRDGESPLHVALGGYEQLGACEALLRARADPSAADVDGETPLHLAARRNAEAACRALLDAAADPNVVDHAGRKAVELARTQEVREQLLAILS